MEIFIQKTGKRVTLDHSGTAASLLEKLDVNPEVVLIVKDGTLITEKDDVDGAEKIDLLSVISGG
jgi:sulfur carrier protein ThiS